MDDGKKRYIILITLVIIAVMFFVTAKSVKENRKLNFFEKAVKDSTSYVLKITYMPIKLIKDSRKTSNEKDKIYRKYKELEKERKEIESYKARIKELENKVDKLKSSLDLKETLADYKTISANVINRGVGSWNDSFVIDKGSKKGVQKGSAVIVDGVLIGKVITVSNFTSTVKLLTSDTLSNKLSVKIQTESNEVYGLFSTYNKKKNVYLVEGISDNIEIKVGDNVVTTGLTELFPSGILIGKVKKIEEDEYGLNKVLEVAPAIKFNNLDIVTVVSRGE